MNTELSLNFGKIIRELRKEKKLSQEELGFQSNLHRTYIRMNERGEKNITLENIEKLSKGLDVSMKKKDAQLKRLIHTFTSYSKSNISLTEDETDNSEALNICNNI